MTLLDEIREYFAAAKTQTKRKIENLPIEFPAWVIKQGGDFGVAIEYSGSIINERFSNCKICSESLSSAGNIQHYLTLTCSQEKLRYEFASVCAQFVDPGKNGFERKRILANPTEWWEQWRTLMGNAVVDHQVYSVIAEMLILNHLYKTNKNVEWTATKAGSKDIEGLSESFEVKSTIVRYGSLITVAGQFQLQQSKPLNLYFCRMEESPSGYSINDAKKMLIENGYDKNKVEMELEKLGFEDGTSNRKKKYKVLEIREYNVDKNFPKITLESFVDKQMPNAVVQLTYTLDLDAVTNYNTISL